ncbi:hypothetical protein GGI02_004025 [Coemansia sp. RSA 2322]|nr:hypothetical protein GGI02_004025 [Coemansia sp. RSA 2322]KAJ2476739.1 hypothetical protein EV174_004831 [Coemansia sp. RSA 2320]
MRTMQYAPPLPQTHVPRIRHPNRPPCVTPSKTLYLRNLNEKTNPKTVASALRALFETYGKVLDVRVRHSIRMRGQAFVVFQSEENAIKAHSEVQGFMLFGKPVFVEFSRMASDASIAEQGGDVGSYKQQRIEVRDRREQEFKERAAQAAAAMAMVSEPELPNKILFLQGLPADVAVSELEQVFAGYAGFVEVRWVSVKPDVAFVEYQTEAQAVATKSALGSQLALRQEADAPVSISFAKR